MADFKKHSNFGPKRSFGGPRSSGPRDFGPKELFDAECSSCHKRTQVPFRPNGKKPVYCRDCFRPDEERTSAPRFEKREFSRPAPRSFGDRDQRPAPAARPEDPRIDDIKRQLKDMNATLERLVASIEGSYVTKSVEAAPKEAPTKTVAAKKSAKKVTKAKKK